MMPDMIDASSASGEALSRRKLLGVSALLGVGLGISPELAFAQRAAMPPVRMVRANGVDLAIYEAGSGPPVVLLHGFPGLAFTWRHQIPALAAAGYRVIVPDLRGYGGSSAPEAVEAYSITQLTGDLVGLLNGLGIKRAVFMGHDWGGLLAWQMPILHPARVAGVISVTTPFIPHWMLWLHPDLVHAASPQSRPFVADAKVDPIVQMREIYSREMYVLKFQDGRSADVAMNRDPLATMRAGYRKDIIKVSEWAKLTPSVANMEYYGQTLPARLPGRDILTAPELDFYATQFQRTGFTPGINWYRNLSRNWRAGRDVDQTVRVPSLMVSAQHDVVLRPSMTDGMGAFVPDLERHVVADSWHYLPEEKPDELNRLAISWLKRRLLAK